MRRFKIIGLHLLGYALLTVAFTLMVSEPLTAFLFPGYHSLETWFQVNTVWMVLLLIATCFSLNYWLRKRST